MNRILIGLAAVLLGSTLTIADVEAKRLGGGKSVGIQRAQAAKPAATPATPQAPAATPAPAARPAAAPAAQPQSGWRKWAAPLAGLAAGLGIAALLSHLGVGAEFAGILLALALAAVAFFVIRRLMAARRPAPDAYAYAGAGAPAPRPLADVTPLATGAPAPATAPSGIPADFDVAGFTRAAKVNFIRLQAAHDAGNLDDLREFTSPEMFAELKLDIDARGGNADKTDVVTLEAEVLDVADEAARHVVSVRFTGLLRESPDAAPAPIDEVWHLTKPRDGSRGWVLAGIQQVQ